MVWIQHQKRAFKQPVMWSWREKENMLHILSLLVLPCLVSNIAEAKGRGGGNGVSLFICLREGRCSGLEVFILHALVTLRRLHSCHLVPLPPRLWRGERGRDSLNQAPRLRTFKQRKMYVIDNKQKSEKTSKSRMFESKTWVFSSHPKNNEEVPIKRHLSLNISLCYHSWLKDKVKKG